MLFNGDNVVQELIPMVLPAPSFQIVKIAAIPKALKTLRNTSKRAVVIIDYSVTNWQMSAHFLEALAQDEKLVDQHAYILLLSTDDTISLQVSNAIATLSMQLLHKPLTREGIIAAVRMAAQKLGLDQP